jgi:hypothetical protein
MGRNVLPLWGLDKTMPGVQGGTAEKSRSATRRDDRKLAEKLLPTVGFAK